LATQVLQQGLLLAAQVWQVGPHPTAWALQLALHLAPASHHGLVRQQAAPSTQQHQGKG
jgi:hypothetical protein